MTVDISRDQLSVRQGPRSIIRRPGPLSAFGFIVSFGASVALSQVPADTAGDRAWIAAYTGSANLAAHLATGICLVLAGASLITFLGALWARIAERSLGRSTTPVPLLLAAASGACIAAGGVLMAGISGAALTAGAPIPSADLLRAGNDFGFGMVSVAGMLLAAFAVASLSVLAHRAGVFGRPLQVLGIVAAVLLLGAVFFVPIVGLMVWLVVAAIALMRGDAARERSQEGG